MAHDFFVSYSSKDKPTADALVATLEQHEIPCWVAPRDVSPGTDYAASLVQAINSSRVFVLVFSSDANSSPHVMREIERAASRGIPILPLRIEDVSYSQSMEYYISSTHWLDALTPPLQQHLERLARSVAALLEADERVLGTETTARPPVIAPVMLELGPARFGSPFGARLTATSYDLTLRNSGDEGVDFQLNAEDDEGRCAFSFPAAVTVPPQRATTVTIKVRPSARRWRGNRQIRWFTIMASSGSGGQPPATVSGQFQDLPYGWAPYGGVALLGAAVAAVFAVTQLAGGDSEKSIQDVMATETPSETTRTTPIPALPTATQMPAPEGTSTSKIGVTTPTPADATSETIQTTPTATIAAQTQVPNPEAALTPVPNAIPVELETTTATGKIAFSSRPSEAFGFWNIYAIDADGSGLANLTNSEFTNEDQPTWSPDGSRIAFVSDRNSEPGETSQRFLDGDIYVMNADGSDPTRVTNMADYASNRKAEDLTWSWFERFPSGAEAPVWSPDGSRLTFAFYGDIYVINPDGTGLTNLTNSDQIEDPRGFPYGATFVDDSYPTWSPDGSRIAFSSFRSRDGSGERPSFFRDIYIMNSDGTGESRLTNDVRRESYLSWSPDGGRIAFISATPLIIDESQDGDLYVIDIDSGVTDLILAYGRDGFDPLTPFSRPGGST